MGMREVRQEIKAAMAYEPMSCSNAHVSTSEMRKIGGVAEAGGVTPGEARLIEDLIDRGNVVRSSQFMTLACPEHPSSWFSIDSGAVRSANALFARNGLPYGTNEAKLRAKVDAALEQIDVGEPLAKAPSTRNLHELFLSDARPVDGPRRDAFIDPRRSQFFLKVTGAGMGGPHTVGPFWYGPFAIDLKSKEVSQKTRDKMRAAMFTAMDAGTLQFGAQHPPLGVRFVRAELARERRPDGYTYTALIPVGALTPTSVPTDPNKAKSFFVERSGGFAGLTQVGGPIAL